MSGPCGFRYSNEWHEVYVCERPGTLQPEGGFRCPQHDRHEIRESVDRGANSRCVLENNGRLNLNWRLLGIDGDRAYIQKIPAYRNRKPESRRIPTSMLRLPRGSKTGADHVG